MFPMFTYKRISYVVCNGDDRRQNGNDGYLGMYIRAYKYVSNISQFAKGRAKARRKMLRGEKGKYTMMKDVISLDEVSYEFRKTRTTSFKERKKKKKRANRISITNVSQLQMFSLILRLILSYLQLYVNIKERIKK